MTSRESVGASSGRWWGGGWWGERPPPPIHKKCQGGAGACATEGSVGVGFAAAILSIAIDSHRLCGCLAC